MYKCIKALVGRVRVLWVPMSSEENRREDVRDKGKKKRKGTIPILIVEKHPTDGIIEW